MANKINFTRYRSADEWQGLGLIGDTLLFTDDEIVTQQAIGYTKHLCKVNCPMDIAVVYSMLNQGEGATPTAKDLLNEHTRLAYYYESGKVADGWYTPPLAEGEEEPFDCGYTGMNDAWMYSDTMSNQGWDGHESWIAGMNPPPVKDLLGLVKAIVANEDGWALARLLRTNGWCNLDWKEHFKDYYKEHMNAKYKMGFIKTYATSPSNYYPSRKAIESKTLLAAIEHLLPHPYMFISGSVSHKQMCGRDGGDHCSTHNKDSSNMVRDWVFADDLRELTSNGAISSYQVGKVQLKKQNCNNLTPFTDHKRRLIQEVNDKEVLRLMNKSLTRMVKRGTVQQVSTGRGRMFSWTAWGWLESVRTRILASNAKQRKLDDVVNGWKYTKGKTTMSYGMEINDHEWVPVEQVTIWTVVMHTPYWNQGHSWNNDYDNGGKIHRDTTVLPHVFFEENEALVYADRLQEFDFSPVGGVSRLRTVSKNFDVTIPLPTYSVTKQNFTLTVDGVAMVEDYSTPKELFKEMQTGNKEQYLAMKKLLRSSPSRQTGMVKQ